MTDTLDAQACTQASVTEARISVKKFVKNMTDGAETEGDVVFQVALWGFGSTEPVADVTFSFAQGVEACADEILDCAQNNALSFGIGKRKYKVLCKGQTGFAVFILDVPPPEESDELDILDEAPNRRGITTALMRHTEKAVQTALGSAHKQITYLHTQLRAKDDRISELEGKYLEVLKYLEELASAKHVRDLEMKRQENEERRTDQISGMLMTLLPLGANKLLGAKLLAEPMGGLDTAIAGLMAGVDQKQFEQLQKILRPDQVMALAEIMMTVEKKAEEAKKAHTEHAPGEANGASSAT